MKKLKVKLLSVFMSFILMFTVITPIVSNAESNHKLGYIDGQTPTGYVTVSMEKFTLGLGYIIEPCKVPIYDGDTGATVITRLMEEILGKDSYRYTGTIKDQSGKVGSSFYLASVKDNDERDANIPKYILDECDEPYGRQEKDWLGEFDYTSMSGWMITVNNDFIDHSAGVHKLEDGDVMRWQFTVWQYGADLGSTFMSDKALVKVANKDKLTTAIGEINSSDNKEKLLENEKISKAYDEAIKVAENMESSQENVDKATKELQNSINSFKAEETNQSILNAINETGAYMLKTVPEAKFGTNSGEWTVLSLARGNIKVPQDYYDNYYKNIESTVKEKEGILSTSKYTEYSRLILGLSSIGKDATNVAGYNLVQPLSDYKQTIKQGINGPIFALIALDSRNYEIPKADDDKEQATREKYIDYILSKEIKTGTEGAGGWALFGTTPDPDITAMALQALATYKDNEKVKPYIERALTKLSDMQKENGGYASWGTTNSESIAQVIVALTSLGINPSTDSRFIKENGWLGSALMEFYCEGGGFKHTLSGTVNAMATDQSMYGLVSYERLLNGKTSLYDMTDVIKEQQEKEDKEAAKVVEEKIESIGEVTLDKKSEIEEVRKAYDNLTEEQKKLVNNLETLTKAEEKISNLEKEQQDKEKEDKKAAKAVEEKIESIGEVTLDKKSEIEEVRKAYDNLTEEQKKLVNNLETLTKAEEKISDLEKEQQDKEEEDKEAAKAVEEKIESIGEVTLDKKSEIEEVRKAYDNLTEEQKKLVNNLEILTKAEEKISDLEKEQQDKEFEKDLEVNNIKYDENKITGKGQSGATVKAYIGDKLIGTSAILKDGTFIIKIEKVAGGTKVTIKMTEDGYKCKQVEKTVLKQIKEFVVNRVKPEDKVVTGRGMVGTTIKVYKNGVVIGKGTVNQKGKYLVKIPEEKLYTKLVVKISKLGYYRRAKTTTVLKVFTKDLTVNSIKSTSTKITGKGQKGATVRAYVNGKQIGKTSKVTSKGTYSILISKQKKGTKVTVKMSRVATAGVYNHCTVK